MCVCCCVSSLEVVPPVHLARVATELLCVKSLTFTHYQRCILSLESVFLWIVFVPFSSVLTVTVVSQSLYFTALGISGSSSFSFFRPHLNHSKAQLRGNKFHQSFFFVSYQAFLTNDFVIVWICLPNKTIAIYIL